jgi:putative endonuclease
MYSVYIIYSEKIDKFYIGYSANLNDRILKHNRSNKGFSSTGQPWALIYSETFEDKKSAMTREKQLKKWKNRNRIIDLINSGSEHPDYQSGGSAVRTRQPPQFKEAVSNRVEAASFFKPVISTIFLKCRINDYCFINVINQVTSYIPEFSGLLKSAAAGLTFSIRSFPCCQLAGVLTFPSATV